MAGLVRAGAERALKIGVVGITLGAIAGLSSLLLSDGMSSAARISGNVFWAIAVLPTATLVVMAVNDLKAGDDALYRSGGWTLGRLLAINVAGATLATVFFYVLATNISGLLKGLDLAALYQAVGQQIGWAGFAVILAAAVLGAGVVAAWSGRQLDR